jgi:spore maturation protein CgeB
MKIAFFGSSLVSSYWNGAATYYRGILAALAERGHDITFYEPDAFERQKHRDMDDPPWARVVVYPAEGMEAVRAAVAAAKGADLIVKASGVGVHDEYLEKAVLEHQNARTTVVFWDVDAPATLERVHQNAKDPFRDLIPRYDLILTYGGGDPVVNAYCALGARGCIPVYNALDPHTHFPVCPDPRFRGDLGFLGNRLPDREKRVEDFFLKAAALLPKRSFLLGGSGWQDKPMPENVRLLGHVFTAEHNAFNCSTMAVLNINRDSMARFGFSPPTRVFEAAGAGACLISDAWEGMDLFLQPGEEVLVARSGEEVAELLAGLTPRHASAIGRRAMHRILSEHTYSRRVAQLEDVLEIRHPRARKAMAA